VGNSRVRLEAGYEPTPVIRQGPAPDENRTGGIQPAHQRRSTDVQRSRLLLCTPASLLLPNATSGGRRNAPSVLEIGHESGQKANLGRSGVELGDRPERPQSVTVFRHSARGAPDVVAREIHVLPTERREVGEQAVGHVLGLSKGHHGALEVSGVPQDDGGDEQVEPRGAVLLVFIGAVADFSEPVDEQ
jgi:hypothetical protein